jgi:hypothetical protein
VDGSVSGVAQLGKKIYVVCGGSALLRVYAGRLPYNRLADVKVEGMENPQDIAECSVSWHLFIADLGSTGCVWRTEVSGKVNKWIQFTADVLPYSLSVTSGRLLVIPSGSSNELLQFGDTPEELKHIPLPRYMNAYHAVETSRGTFAVCHTGRPGNEKYDQVSEVDIEGRVIRVYGGQRGHGPRQLNEPHHLAQDAAGRLLVADCYNRRILLLSSQLELYRILLDSVDLGF